MPAHAHAVAHLETCHGIAHGRHQTHHLVAGNVGVVAGHAVSDHGVAVAHAAGLHLNEHLVLVDGGHGHLLSHNRARARKRSGAAPIPQRSLGPKAPPL